MGDYDLSGLNPRGFEHLVQALAKKVIAQGVRPFGDGKDGGREATFDGPMSYPSDAAPWNGYLTIQAKFLQRPFRTTDEGAWVRTQLEAELSKYRDQVGNRRIPEYYVFVTNAVLTPASNIGGVDKADTLIESYQPHLNLKGYEVWHYDTLCRFLDGQEDIRRAYTAFITPGDVLAGIMRWLDTRRPDFEMVMSAFLQKQMYADQFVKLGQAGYASEEKTSLAQVFVDLTATEERLTEPTDERADAKGGLPKGFVSQMIDIAGQLLNPETLLECAEAKRPTSSHEELTRDLAQTPTPALDVDPGRYVLIGGPGQGKTTVGQYLCQLHRAAILKDRPPHTLSSEAREALRDIQESSSKDGIALPSVRRFPVRIVLSHLAAELSAKTVSSLLMYVARTIAATTAREVSADDLQTWLGAYPWIIVLDGLDEVPASSNREQLMSCISDFWSDAAQVNADVMVVATTRPQGYGLEFSPRYYRHLYLTPLSPQRGRHYAVKLLTVRYPEDTEARDRILRGLERAIRERATARLMRSPLQVTVMALLVDRHGDPPNQRWPLFQKYYDVVYDRELAKGSLASSVLRDYKIHIDAVHQHVGLRLHLDGAQAGATEALLTSSEFGQLVRVRLVEAGYMESKLEEILGNIITAAMHRLVFLVAPIAERVGFEIRSLQEFMAAEAIMSGNDQQVSIRLEAIATVAYWRNVLLFAAGRVIATREHMFAIILSICDALNEHDPRLSETSSEAATLQGSRLALDLLDDGLARDFPKHIRTLARKSLRLLRLPPNPLPGDPWTSRLAGQFSPDTEEIFFEEIERGLTQISVFDQLSAWDLLHRLQVGGSERAARLRESHWPSDPTDALEILRTVTTQHKHYHFIDIWVNMCPHVTLHQIGESNAFPPMPNPASSLPTWFIAASKLFDRKSHGKNKCDLDIPIRLDGTDLELLRLHLLPVGEKRSRDICDLLHMPEQRHPAWLPVIEGARFIENPSSRSLAAVLRAIADVWYNKSYAVRIPTTWFPWPLAECVHACAETGDFARMSERAESGEFGDYDDWVAAEVRWATDGLNGESFNALSDEHWPYDIQSLQKGLPIRDDNLRLIQDTSSQAELDAYTHLYDHLPPSRIRREVANLFPICFGYRGFRAIRTVPMPAPDRLTKFLRESSGRVIDVGVFADLGTLSTNIKEWVDLFDFIGTAFRLTGFHYAGSKLPEIVLALHVQYPERSGLIGFLGDLAILGYPIPRHTVLLEPTSFSDPLTSLYAFLLHLMQLPTEAGQLVPLVAAARTLISQTPIFVNTISDVVIQRMKGVDLASAFITEILTFWPRHEWLSKGRAIAFLESERQTQRNSLSDPILRISLGVPNLHKN